MVKIVNKKNILKKKSFRFVCVTIVSFLISLFVYYSGALDYFELKTYDNRMLVTSDFVQSSSDIFFIIINQESLDWAKKEKGWSWPWPREAYAQMIDFINAGNPKSITFDMLYSEPSVYGKDDDLKFAQSIQKSNKVFQTIFVYSDNQNEKVVLPIDEIKNAAKGLGNITSLNDLDDVIRRTRISYNFNGIEYPSLGFIPIWKEFDKSKVPVLNDGTLLLRFKKSIDEYLPYSMSDILKSYDQWKNGKTSDLIPEDFSNGHVFFALYAPGLFDICSSPVSQVYPGVGIHITALDNFLNNSFVRKVSDAISIIWIFVLCILGSLIVYLSHRIKGQLKNLLFIILGFFISIVMGIGIPYLLFIPGYWIICVVPIFAFILSFIISISIDFAIEGKQRRFIKSAFSQYLSPSVIDKLISEPDKLTLGGERRKISIYFSDIEGFTSISERFSQTPEILTEILNKYLSAMTDIILQSGGTIDKYEGDAIIAFWNAPLSLENHAECAIQSALNCQKKLEQIQSELEKLCGTKIYQRIGINTGYAVVGNMGSQSRFDYTMLGDSVNLASRLEGLNKQFGTYTMCSQTTMEEVALVNSSIKWRKLANVAVVGKKESVVVYEPFLECDYERKKDLIAFFEKGLDFFTLGQFDKALLYFEKNKENDKPSLIYFNQCKEYISNPPDAWNGVWISKSK